MLIGTAISHWSNPHSEWYVNSDERRALANLKSGRLQQELEEARAQHGGAVQAEPFRMSQSTALQLNRFSCPSVD